MFQLHPKNFKRKPNNVTVCAKVKDNMFAIRHFASPT